MTDFQTPYPVPTPSDQRHNLWQFSQRLYAEPDVESLCLHLQDEHNVNVLLLLWCAWLEMRDIPLSTAQLAEALEIVASQSEPTVVRLREVRRYIKGHDMLPAPIEKQVRNSILTAELAIEKHLLMELEARTQSFESPARAKGAAVLPLDRLVQDWGLMMAGEWLKVMRQAAERAYGDEDTLA